ncbi:MAG: hypothetical protein WBN22_10220 [Verrucomicrobiia bacterium]
MIDEPAKTAQPQGMDAIAKSVLTINGGSSSIEFTMVRHFAHRPTAWLAMIREMELADEH